MSIASAFALCATLVAGAPQITNPDPPAAADPLQPEIKADEPADALPTIADKTKGLVRADGLFTVYRDDNAARIWLVVPPPVERGRCARFIYVESIATGVGSNPIGLDRGQLGPSRLVELRRLGRRVLLEEQNLRFRASSDLPAERRAVRESFATSVLWGAKIAALDEDGTSLVELSSFIARDAHGLSRRLKDAGEGSWSLDSDRSGVDPSGCLLFPDNIELEAILTFSSLEPGRRVRSVAPDPTALTVVQHHSLIRLPDDLYLPRRFDPRCGSSALEYLDYAVPLGDAVDRRWIARHRLEKSDPAALRSRPIEPIVYYVDRGAPEPIRSALIEGASWWAAAFDAAGFRDAYRVEVMPPGAHPLDVRYNVIQWVHRSTRGWSYGGAIDDPRTGEILKGHVSLGSLRVRQDILLFEGLAGTAATGTGAPDDAVELALARIRQLAAHEVGHTLGFVHNFAASAWGDRASVMDYPAPLIDVTPEGQLDFSRAYGVGVGAWDMHTVRYAYTQFVPGEDEDAALAAILAEAERRGMPFLSDADARAPGSAHPIAGLWDNGPDPVAALERTLRVRALGIALFGDDRIVRGRSLGRLHDVFAPVYLHHRYQIDAAAKVVGGRHYRYGVRGAEAAPVTVLPADVQRRAVDAMLECVDPALLDVPDSLLALLAPAAPGDRTTGERFEGRSDPIIDPVAMAVTAATPAIAGLLEPARCARLVDQHRRDPAQPGVTEILDTLLDRAVLKSPADARLAPIQEAIAHTVVERMAGLAMNRSASPVVRVRAETALRRAGDILSVRGDDPVGRGLARAITRALDRRTAGEWSATTPAAPPPGSPIGARGCSVDGG